MISIRVTGIAPLGFLIKHQIYSEAVLEGHPGDYQLTLVPFVEGPLLETLTRKSSRELGEILKFNEETLEGHKIDLTKLDRHEINRIRDILHTSGEPSDWEFLEELLKEATELHVYGQNVN